MKLAVQNLGRIDRAEFEIRPLTVFIGENGTNKTWVAYALYGLMRGWGAPGSMSDADLRSGAGYDKDAKEAFYRLAEDNERLAKSLAEAGGASVSVERDLRQYFPEGRLPFKKLGQSEFLRQLLRLTEVSRAFEVRLEVDRRELHEGTDPVQIRMPESGAWVDIHAPGAQRRVVVDSAAKLRSVEFWREVLTTASILWLRPQPGMLMLPAERKALASAHDLLRDEFTQAVSVPVADYAEFLRRQRNLVAHGVTAGTATSFQDLAGILESQVVHGSINLLGGAGGARFSFWPSAQTELPIHAASSLVRAVAGLDLYLWTTARPGDFLFIDEVEMNAHPEAQLALVELLAMLVNRGLHVVMTTHSPYVVEHLNNLMAAAQAGADRRDELSALFRLRSSAAFLPSGKVSAYGFTPAGEKVNVSDVLDRDAEAIDWTTFSRITDELSDIYGRILEVKGHS